MKATPSLEEWIKKIWYTCEYNGILVIKKNENFVFATTWMDLEDIMFSDISDRERQILYNCTYMKNLKNKINQEQTNETKANS